MLKKNIALLFKVQNFKVDIHVEEGTFTTMIIL